MSISMKDIAKLAGVSPSTVSRCLNDSSLISEETKNAVKKIAMEQGFEFNANARSLSTRKTGTIGVIYPENFSDFSNSLFLNPLHNQLRDRLEKENLDLIISFPINRYSGESNIQKLVGRKKVDGLIIASNELSQETLSYLNKTKIPFVFMHHFVKNSTIDFNFIGTDDEHGGYLAAQYLIQLGHTRILCISGKDPCQPFEQRTNGFMAALQDNGLNPKAILYADMSFHSGYEMIKNNSGIVKNVTAIFVQTDIIALGVIEGLKNQNIRVPEDVSVIGYDDIDLCTYSHPHLTTIHQPIEEIAVLTCERLLDLIQSNRTRDKKQVLIKPRLVIRESCRKIENFK